MKTVMILIRTAIALAILGLIAVGAVWLADHPGHVAIEWLGRRIDLPVALAGGLLLIAVLLVIVLYRIGLGLWRGPKLIRRSMMRGRERRGYEALAGALLAMAEGDLNAAGKQLNRASRALEQPLFMDLIASRIAQLAGDRVAQDRLYERLSKHPATAFAALRGQIDRAVEDGDLESAERLLEKAQRAQPKMDWVLDHQRRVFYARGKFEAAKDALKAQRRHKLIGNDEHSWKLAEILTEQAASLAARDEKRALDCAREASRLKPGLIRASLLHARLLALSDKRNQALRVLENAWQAQPHPDLVGPYLALAGGESAERRRTALDDLTRAAPDHMESRLARAAEALRRQDWSRARQELEALGTKKLSRTACRLYAELERLQFHNERAAQMWELRAVAAPERAWVCGHCGAGMPVWRSECAACGTAGGLQWTLAAPPGARSVESGGELAVIDETRRDFGDQLYERLAEGEARDATEREARKRGAGGP